MAMPQRDDPPTFLRASAYALCAMADKTADKYDPPSLLRASAYALCAMAVKTADKSADKYEIGGEGVARWACRATGGVLPLTPGGRPSGS